LIFQKAGDIINYHSILWQKNQPANMPKKENVTMNANKLVDKKYEKMSFKELAKAPVSAIAGITEKDEELLKQAFKVKTVADLAKLKYVKWAQAIVTLAEGEE
jgi:hypothetical protein